MKSRVILLILILSGIFAYQRADACTRVVYTGDTTATSPDQVLRIVGRSLDWSVPIPTNLFVYPRGMEKQSNKDGKMIHWKSKYGSVYAVSYNAGITEGMNEKGLAVNGLFCRSTIYNSPKQENDARMSMAVIDAWMLDNCATTQEVIDLVKKQDFFVTGATFDGGTVSTIHWGITDPTGFTAILEFQDGKLNIYSGYDLPVLTNDPPFDQMNAINDYWLSVGGQNMLPGGVRSADRFVRTYFFEKNVARTNDANEGLAITKSIIYDASVPYKYNLGNKELSQTQWRSFSNLRDKLYYFANVNDLGLYYVDLKACDLSEGAPVLYFDTSKATSVVGDITKKMVPSAPFTPMY